MDDGLEIKVTYDRRPTEADEIPNLDGHELPLDPRKRRRALLTQDRDLYLLTDDSGSGYKPD